MTGPRVDPTGNIDLAAPAPSAAPSPTPPVAAPPRAGGGAGPDVEMELARLANDAMAQHPEHAADITDKLHQSISYLRQFPKMAEHATNALSDGVATPADISRTLWPHVQAMSHATGPNAPTAAESADLPMDETTGSRFGGGLANALHDVPGGEALTAGLHSVAHGEPYRQSLKTVQAAEQQTPAVVRVPLRIGGSIAGQMAMPGSGVTQAARYGLAMGIGDARPMSLADRLKNGATNAAIDGAVSAATTGLTTGIRAKFLSDAPDANVVARNNAMRAADVTNYGKSAAEGAAAAAHPTPAVLTTALDDPDIKPYADMIRSSRKFQGANDATVAAETFKLMTKQQGGLARRLSEQGFDAATQLQHDNIGLAKDQLRSAAETVMPSFGKAVDAHALAAGETRAVERGKDMAGMAMNGTQPMGSKLGVRSLASYLNDVPKMTPGRATAASEGVLGQAGQNIGLKLTPTSLFGAVPSARALKVAPLVGALDKQAGNNIPEYLRRAAVAGGQSIEDARRNLGLPQSP